MYEILADNLLLQHSLENAAALGMLQELEEDPPDEHAGESLGWDDTIRRAYETGNLPHLKRTLAAHRQAAREVCRIYGIDPGAKAG